MERRRIAPRTNWKARVEAQGFHYHTFDGETYWDESAYYVFTEDQIDEIELATAELHNLYIDAAQHVIDEDRLGELFIPDTFKELVVESWNRDDPSIFGRFDLHYDGKHPPRLFEYNADTPTGLFEASAIQWFWMKDQHPDADQFNSIHERLIEAWRQLGRRGLVHFACARNSLEDLGNLEYMRDTAIQAGVSTTQIFIDDLGWDDEARAFTDLDDHQVETVFKLYPWEWLMAEDFGPYLLQASWRTIEPPWKLIWSNKALLPILHELYPDHPNLLRASLSENDFRGKEFVKKPIFAREGANVEIHAKQTFQQDGPYGKEGFVFQEFLPLPEFDGRFPVIGSWVIDGEPAGIGVREDATLITTNDGTFVPHIFTGASRAIT